MLGIGSLRTFLQVGGWAGYPVANRYRVVKTGRIEMGTKIALAALLVWVIGSPPTPSFAQPAPLSGRCLHGPSEQPNQRARREQALKMADDINRAESAGPAVIPCHPLP